MIAIRYLEFGIIAHGPENVLYVGRNNLHLGGTVSPGADLYGLAGYDRGLVGSEMAELGRPNRGRRSCSFRV
jgi:hypothetical protein